MFLDLVGALIAKKFPNFEVHEYNGSIGSNGAGRQLRKDFENTSQPASASILFQCEPWWNSNDEEQAYYRLHRIGQHRPVLVFVFRGSNSSIDTVIDTMNKKNVGINAQTVEHMVESSPEPSNNDIPAVTTVKTSQQSLSGESTSASARKRQRALSSGRRPFSLAVFRTLALSIVDR
ncbi:DNA repair protein rad16 [Coniosporium apollinis]|uniref:DNA repair protein rad16 n=1 Tax=Coniosporium apollinis TaxID=61459 RepID=A0ABQ9NNY7_9PEZI|nr:DNA repair protein rad16 [Coniosporium apollinis]